MRDITRKLRKTPWGATAALTAVAFGASAGLERADEPTPPPLPHKALTFRDIQLTVHARKALADDPELGPANLGVRVQDNTAVLWGPAPSEDLKRRAVDLVKKVKGIFEVRDADVYIAPPTPAVNGLTPAAPPEAPTHTESASPDTESGEIDSLTARPAVDPPAAPVVVLQAPLPVDEPSPHTVAAAPPAEGLTAAVERVRRDDPRFQAVDCRLQGDVIELRRGQGSAEEVMAFARAVARLPGVSRIVVQTDEARP